MDKITVSIATMPGRYRSLKESVLRLLPQCDELIVYLNEFNGKIPKFLLHPRVTVYESEKEAGDLGATGRFYKIQDVDGYIFPCDDDIVYPHDYIKQMVKSIDQYDRKVLLSCHGRLYNPLKPVNSYYTDTIKFFSFHKQVLSDTRVQIVGIGVSGYHTSELSPDLTIFPHKNMDDIYLSIYAQKKGLDCIVKSHPGRWLKVSKKYDPNFSISRILKNEDRLHSSVLNSFLKSHEFNRTDRKRS